MLNTINNSYNYFTKTMQPTPTLNNGQNRGLLSSLNNYMNNNVTSSTLSSNNILGSTIDSNLNSYFMSKGIPILGNKIGNKASWLDQAKAGFGDIKGDLIGLAPAALDMGLDMIGGDSLRRADVMSGGDNLLSTVGDLGWQIGSKLGPAGMIAGGAVKLLSMANERLGKTSDKNKTHGIVTTGYTTEFNPLADQKYSLFGNRKRKRTNRMTKNMDLANLMKSVPGYQQQSVDKLLNNSLGDQHLKNQQQLWGGLGTQSMLAKKGGKIHRTEFEHIIRKAKSNVKLHKSGGKLEDPNIIPDGAFHSRKNNLPDEIAKDVTHKGIPVIIKDGDKITQIAEIERSEIVFNKKVSEQIEDYLKDYDKAETQKEKDKIAIECGKLISDQIINNTIDNVGLLNKE